MQYGVPRIFARAGILDRFYSDFCASQGWPRVLNLLPAGLRPEKMRRLLARSPVEIPLERIRAFNSFGLSYAIRLGRAQSSAEKTALFLWAGREFCRRILAEDFGNANAVYTFNSAGLEVLQAAKRRGLLTVMEQTIAPREIERRILSEEQARFPGWESAPETDPCAQEYADRERAEWGAADRILCGSEFVRDGIRECGGPVEKCVVVPYGVDVPEGRRQKAEGGAEDGGQRTNIGRRPLRVLTVGTVGLRKGLPYVLEAARQLKGRAQFRMVGSIGVTREAETQLREHLELIGSVPRSEMGQHFAWADIFLLPSLCEGSATATYEALGYGLPVICTPNTGSVVRDGVEGYIVPPFDAPAIVGHIEQMATHVDLVDFMSTNAAARALEFTMEKYGERLLTAAGDLIKGESKRESVLG
jgi:glycosyltransferase involved in cell wall biosynthesis